MHHWAQFRFVNIWFRWKKIHALMWKMILIEFSRFFYSTFLTQFHQRKLIFFCWFLHSSTHRFQNNEKQKEEKFSVIRNGGECCCECFPDHKTKCVYISSFPRNFWILIPSDVIIKYMMKPYSCTNTRNDATFGSNKIFFYEFLAKNNVQNVFSSFTLWKLQ